MKKIKKIVSFMLCAGLMMQTGGLSAAAEAGASYIEVFQPESKLPNFRALKSNNIKIVDFKTENTEAEDTKENDTEKEDMKAEDTNVEGTKAENTKAEDTKAENTKAEDTKTEDTKTEGTKVDDSNTEDMKPNDPDIEDTEPKDTEPNDTGTEKKEDFTDYKSASSLDAEKEDLEEEELIDDLNHEQNMEQKYHPASPLDALREEELDFYDARGTTILLEDTFDNGDNWKKNNANVTFVDGKALIKGAGPNNCMQSNFKINAKNFIIEFDLILNEGNTNANGKIGFKAKDGFESDRFQLRFDFVRKTAFIERVTGNTLTKSYANTPVALEATAGTHRISIVVSEDTITAYMDGNEFLSAQSADFQSMENGYLIFAGQYPKQDFAIDNLMVSTDDLPQGDLYQITLKAYTDGVENSAGGTLSADKTEGYSGETITLSPKANSGYVFDRFTSFTHDGTPTDGLVPIVNNKFQLNEKFGSMTVIAHFKTRMPGRDELFYDDFGGTLNHANQYKTIGNVSLANIISQELHLDAPAGSMNYLLVDNQIFDNLKADEGYRISVDLKKADSAAGTLQISFRGSDQNAEERYVLAINSAGKAMIRRIHNGVNTELKSCSFNLSTNKSHVVLEVKDGFVTFSADGRELMRYEDTDNGWAGMPVGAGLYNMTGGAPIIYDNFMIEKIAKKVSLDMKVMYQGNEDKEGNIGIVSADKTQVSEGDEVVLNAISKPGYRLKEYRLDDFPAVAVTNGRFTVPEGVVNSLAITAEFEAAPLRAPMTFYIDSAGGNDAFSGNQESAAWKSLGKLSSYGMFVPGDKILLKRGSVFTGQQLAFTGSGKAGSSIIIDTYGNGDLPRLDGSGQIENVVSLYNQEYITIRNLEITNTTPEFKSSFTLNGNNNTSKALRAINVSIRDFGTASGIYIEDCFIHDINGNNNLKWNGGIFFDVKTSVVDGKLSGVLSKYDDVLISGCTFLRVDRSGIKLVNSNWCNQWEPNSPDLPIHWYPSTNVVVRNNYMEKIGGDGITVRDTDGALIEYNLVRDCRYQNTGYNVGIWPFEAANTVIQYNEAYDTHSTTDGQGLDCDHASSNSVMQYNYSHNNEGGFMLIMGGYPHTGVTIRYNISQNDRDKTFEFAQGCPMGTMIYNNTIYSDTIVNRGIFFLSNSSAGRGVSDTFAYNNLFHFPQGQSFLGGPETAKLNNVLKLYNNAYSGGMAAPSLEPGALVVADAGLMNGGSGPETNSSYQPVTGAGGKLDGYKLKETSELVDAGITMEEAILYFGGSQPFDGRNMSPRDLYEMAAGKKSIDYVMGNHFPLIDGVDYHLDFLGNENTYGVKPDIGAIEYGSKPPIPPTVPPVNPPINPPVNPSVSPSDDYEESVDTAIKNQEDNIPNTPGLWEKEGTGWKFKKPDGSYYQNEWIYNGKNWYWTNQQGMMAEGWQQINDKWYFFHNITGTMAAGWVQSEGKWFYLDETGAMLTNAVTPDGYVVDENGVWSSYL